MRLLFLLGGMMVTVVSYCMITAEESSRVPVSRDDVQAALHALLSNDPTRLFDGTEAQLQEKLAQLRGLLGGSDPELVMELAVFSVHASDMREAMLAGVIIDQLGISKRSIAEGALGLLGTQDKSLRERACDLLSEVDSSSGERPDFTTYLSIVRDSREAPPEALIAYMYRKDADAALLTMADIYTDSVKVRHLEEEIKESENAIDVLSRSPEWWSRLYSAEVMRQSPRSRHSAIIQSLRDDPNFLVRETARQIGVGQQDCFLEGP